MLIEIAGLVIMTQYEQKKHYKNITINCVQTLKTRAVVYAWRHSYRIFFLILRENTGSILKEFPVKLSFFMVVYEMNEFKTRMRHIKCIKPRRSLYGWVYMKTIQPWRRAFVGFSILPLGLGVSVDGDHRGTLSPLLRIT